MEVLHFKETSCEVKITPRVFGKQTKNTKYFEQYNNKLLLSIMLRTVISTFSSHPTITFKVSLKFEKQYAPIYFTNS